MVNFSIEGKVAVITGGAGILCSMMGRELSKLGAKIALLDLNGEMANKVADEINRAGGKAIGVAVNVLDKASIEAARDVVMAEYGCVDILINGAGGNKPAATASADLTFFDMPADAVQWVLNLNLMGTILPSQVFGKVMADQGDGAIVNISSMAAFTPLTNTVAYSAAKSAISNFTQWLSVYLCHNVSSKIRVNAIAPGFLHTQQNHFLLEKEDGTPTQRGKNIIAATPMARYGLPEELVGGVVYLCSEAASFVTGIVLPIDGGYLAYSGV